MTKAPPFTYVSIKELKNGRREYWRFRHPNTGEVKMIGKPGEPEFMWQYNQLLAKVGLSKKVSRRDVRREANPLAQLEIFEVYFIAAEPDGPIKIGYAKNAVRRLKALQTGSHVPLCLLATMPGGPAIERTIHRALADTRMDGEWFERSPRLLSFIEDLRNGAFTLEGREANPVWKTGLPPAENPEFEC